MNGMHPLAANWMITYRCPGQCRFCLTSSGPADARPELPAEDKLRAVEILASLGVRRISIMGGEPFVLRELPAVVRCAYLHGVKVNITTSGRGALRDLQRISAGLQYLNVSLDGAEDYNDRYRGIGSYALAVQTIRDARAAGIPVRLYTVLTTQNSDRAALDWRFSMARELGVLLIMFIFLSPTGRAADCAELRVPEAERGLIMEHIRAAGAAHGVRFKDCDPYLPEGFKLFLDADGSVYRHAGGGVQDALGSLLARPDGGPWQALSEAERQEHWREFADQLDGPPFPESAASVAPAGMAYVAPGVFRMGAGQGAHPVYVDGFYIDTHQVTNAQYAEFLNACGNRQEAGGPWLDIATPECLIETAAGRFRAKPGYERYPVVMVSWHGARAYAAWCGKRLPTEAEWEKAALGGVDGRVYPWGDEPPGDQCNWRDYAGVHAHRRPDFYHGRGPLPVGLFAPNEYGLYDLAGNVWEWCADWHAPEPSAGGLRINPHGSENGRKKILRGGSWSFDPANLRVAHRAHADPAHGYAYDGFRCALGGIERLLREYGLAALEEGQGRDMPAGLRRPAACSSGDRRSPQRLNRPAAGHELQDVGAEDAVPSPVTTTFRGILPDERCRFRPLSGAGVRVVMRVTYRCDLACPHCLVGVQAAHAELRLADWERILAQLPAIGARKVLLTGGEPLLHPDLVALVRSISALGIPADLNSNLQRMTPALLDELQRAGLTELSVSLEGPAAVHDRMHGKAGALAQTLRAIEWAAERGLRVDASCCLTADNVPRLRELFALLGSLPLQSFTVSRLFPIGHGKGAARQSVPQADLDALYDAFVRDWLPRAPFPVRLVGLLGCPRPADCARGESLIGLTPQGEVVACVLAAENPVGIPHPLDVGLAEAVARMRAGLVAGAFALCCEAGA